MTFQEIKFNWISDFLSETVLTYEAINNSYYYVWTYEKNDEREITLYGAYRHFDSIRIRTRMKHFFNIDTIDAMECIGEWCEKEISKYELNLNLL